MTTTIHKARQKNRLIRQQPLQPKSLDFEELVLKSLFATDGPSGSVDDVLAWVRLRNQEVIVRINRKPFSELKDWRFDPTSGNLCHESGKFFSIEGIHVFKDDGKCHTWTQPIINQPEIGILGIVTKVIDGVLCFLLQAKIEPGNVNNVQLSPTLQATRSNYSQVHKGKKPRYLELFVNAKRSQIVLDQLQSEQGGRFLRKRNRNIILKLDEDVPSHEDFQWLTLGQIKALMAYDNVVNMDTRTVISGLPYHSSICGLSSYDFNGYMRQHDVSPLGRDLFISEISQSGCNSIQSILFWLSELRSKYELVVDKIPLRDIQDWQIGENEIVHKDRRFFRVIGVEAVIESREVKSWCQPLFQPMQEGLCAFIVKRINGVYHFLIQAKIESGNFDVVEMAPTVQCITGGYKERLDYNVHYLDYLLSGYYKNVWLDSKQSEEGGRFYREQNRYLVVESNDDFSEDLPQNFIWMTLGQSKEFLRFNNFLNIQARSLIAALNYR